jgi:hypothetical protein
MMNQNRSRDADEKLEARRTAGALFGYVGMLFGLMGLLATTSEGTPFRPHEAAWFLFACMAAAYLAGWLAGHALTGNRQTR